MRQVRRPRSSRRPPAPAPATRESGVQDSVRHEATGSLRCGEEPIEAGDEPVLGERLLERTKQLPNLGGLHDRTIHGEESGHVRRVARAIGENLEREQMFEAQHRDGGATNPALQRLGLDELLEPGSAEHHIDFPARGSMICGNDPRRRDEGFVVESWSDALGAEGPEQRRGS